MKKIVIIAVIVLTLLAGYLYLFQPHISFEEIRSSETPIEIKAVYVNVTGDPLCAKLYRLERMQENKPIASSEPLFLGLPDGMPSPEDGDLAYADNLFLIKGYGYQYAARNKLTGNSKMTPSNRIDVLAWEVIAPYKKWKNEDPGGDELLGATIETTPVKHGLVGADHSPDKFVKNNYIDCLK